MSSDGDEARGRSRSRRRFAVVGPVFPYRGGIAQYTTVLHHELASCHEVRLFNFTRQYPSLLFPGRTQLDLSASPLDVPSVRCIDSLSPLSWWRTARLVEEAAPDLTVFMWWQPFFAPSMGSIARLLARRGRRCVFLCHNVIPHEGSRLDRLLTRWAFAPAVAFVVHSSVDVASVAKLAPSQPIRVNPHPIYEQFGSSGDRTDEADQVARARRELGLPTDARVLLFFGLVRAYKGLAVLLEALARLPDLPEVRLVVAGECYEPEGPYRERIERLAIGPRVRFENRFVANEEVSRYFTACDVVVLPYVSASQSGIVQIAYAHGRPVIATRVGGLPEIVFEGETGLLVEPEDPAALERAIRDFYARGGRHAFLAGIAAWRGLFSWSHMRAVLEDLSVPAPTT